MSSSQEILDAADSERSRKKKSLEALVPPRTGRGLVIFTISGCVPCKSLLQAIQSAVSDPRLYDVSNLPAGDVLTRTHHIRLGARTYPTVLLIDGPEIVEAVVGCAEDGDSINLGRYLSFLGLEPGGG